MKLRRGPLLPDEARAGLPVEDGERVIAAGRTGDGGWAAATGLALVTADGRTPWVDVAHAQWYDEQRVLVLDLVPGAGPSRRIGLADPGRLPETVHERVMASIVLSRRFAVPGGAVRVVARRADGSTDTVWQVVPDAGTDLTTPEARAAADAAVATLAAELG